MRQAALALFILVTSTACGGAEGDPCEPFPNAAERVYAGCEGALICVGTAGNGRCARADQPSALSADAALEASGMGAVKRSTAPPRATTPSTKPRSAETR